ncbi:uncharacterized WD repeat-containing protein L264 [Filimonas sp.]|nr:uncharacterized WD repeat-containing protein L264 [Filimonas sp.]
MKNFILTFIFIILVFFLLHQPSNAQSTSFQWAKDFSGTNQVRGNGITTDSIGNVYTVGWFDDTVDFDPGPGVYNLVSQQLDIFISKLDSSGNFLWAKQIGGTAYHSATTAGIRLDASGNIYLAGAFSGSVDFDPGAGFYTLSSSFSLQYSDIFISKMDASGNLIWARQIGGDSSETLTSITMDISNNIYVEGNFQGIVDFDPGVGISNLNSSSPSIPNMYILKLDSAGNFDWARNIDILSTSYANSLAVDKFENLYVTGSFFLTVDFDPGPGVYNLTSANCDIIVLKLDSLGNFIWADQIGGTQCDIGFSVAVDSTGNIYSTGWFQGTADFDPGPGVFTMTSIPMGSQYISKLDTAGHFLWAKQKGGMAFTDHYFIAVDPPGNVYTTGCFSGTKDFDPNAGIVNLVASGYRDAFISKLDSGGHFLWAKRMGGVLSDVFGFGICLDAANTVYTTGYYGGGLADFDTGPGVTYLAASTSNINWNTYVHKLKQQQCYPTYSSMNIVSCNPYTINGQTYSVSGNYTQVLTNAASCDSLLQLNLAINSTTSLSSQSACNSYIWNGQTYATSGLYAQTYTNAAGCDSILNLDLTIHNSSLTSIVQTACFAYQLNSQTYTSSGIYTQSYLTTAGCDSIFSLNLTINPTSYTSLSQTSCYGYTLNGQTYTNTGVYAQYFINAIGCDSILLLNLTIHSTTYSLINQVACFSYSLNGQTYTASGLYTQTFTNVYGCDSLLTLNVYIDTVNTTVTLNNLDLTANASGATYQWLLCPAYTTISGATNQTYSAITNGSYAVAITQNGCTDTSVCIAVTGVGISDNLGSNDIIRVSPNPSQGEFNILSEVPLEDASLRIINSVGQIILIRHHLSGKSFSFNLSDQAYGIYEIEMKQHDSYKRIKIIKE